MSISSQFSRESLRFIPILFIFPPFPRQPRSSNLIGAKARLFSILNDSGRCLSTAVRRSFRQTPRTERFPRVLPSDIIRNVFHLLISGRSYSTLNASGGTWSQNIDCILRCSSIVSPLRQQSRRDVRSRFPQSHVRFPRAARGPGPSSGRVYRVFASISMMPDSLVDSLTNLVLEVRVTLPHEFPMISAGPSQLPKHQLDILERLAVLGHSSCPVHATPRPSLKESLAFRTVMFRAAADPVMAISISFRFISEVSRIARRRRRRRRAWTERIAGRPEDTAEFEGGFS